MEKLVKISVALTLFFSGIYLVKNGYDGLLWVLSYYFIIALGGGILIDMWKNRKGK